ncbi:uncharacterized protein LOC131155448 isoform X3 [Malania oleifera]|uniref:uncharacterized protein LOC131155448 isoform X3 n=1 Tax=Malania oleifera TaxID=397392 RepID=UPI0025ADDADD|nr:uncharacterized protein LOC131155448 isoform X3 [Malania oleifera]
MILLDHPASCLQCKKTRFRSMGFEASFDAYSAEQEGIKADPIELSQFVDLIRCNKLQSECFFIGPNQYMVTSNHEFGFCARCMNSSRPAAGGGAIIMQTTAFLLVAFYEGSIGAASLAMAAADQFSWQLGRKNF